MVENEQKQQQQQPQPQQQPMGGGKKDIKRQIRLPISEAIRISFRNVKLRIGRALITTSGIFLGIAFFASMMTNENIAQLTTATGDVIKQKQIWLLTMSLLVSALGIINAMLMSVLERYREIGTMKCLGALDEFIVQLFLLESGFLGFFGALFGAITGTLMVVISALIKMPVLFSKLPWLALLSNIGIGVLLGTVLAVLCAIYPAYRAAQMAPALAMRADV
ncbi:MAG: FtsX-like permease family protein [Elusimicrobiota bacterium]